MTKTINARNVNEAFHIAMTMFNDYRNIDHGDILKQDSRNGEVLRFRSPTLIEYRKPDERVLFHPERDANPFFHFFESLWMLEGLETVSFLEFFNKRMIEYSDDGIRLNGAYGYRWRQRFKIDQIAQFIDILRVNPDDRRAVIQMWDIFDLGIKSLDVPCNTHIYFSIVECKLNMTVCNRSNDMIWGALGANVVHFSILQEYMASAIGVELGSYFQFANNLHVYTDLFNKLNNKINKSNLQGFAHTEYELGDMKPSPLVDNLDTFLKELNWFIIHIDKMISLESWSESLLTSTWYENKVFYEVAGPMFIAWSHWKSKNIEGAIKYAKKIKAKDWNRACVDWLERKKTKI